jgi:hypothetical protein
MLILADSVSFSPWPTLLGIGGTLAGLVVGFGLNEMSSIIRGNREARRTVGSALTELLEVRHELRMFPLALKSLKETIPIPITAVDEFTVRKVLSALIPDGEGLQNRYASAVSAVAGEFPTLAFGLRSKDAMGPLLGRLRGSLPIEAKDMSLWLKIEDGLIAMAIPKLDELIMELAAIHGRSTVRHVKPILRKPAELDPEFAAVLRGALEPVIAAFRASQGSGAAGNPPNI